MPQIDEKKKTVTFTDSDFTTKSQQKPFLSKTCRWIDQVGHNHNNRIVEVCVAVMRTDHYGHSYTSYDTRTVLLPGKSFVLEGVTFINNATPRTRKK